MDNKKQSRIERWFTKPYRTGLALPAALLIMAMGICILWVKAGMDNDSYYMIAQGREILNSGIPYKNTFTFMDDKIVVQQWLYCVLIALADKIPGNWGLLCFMLVQAMALAITISVYIRKSIKDPFWVWLAASLVMIVPHTQYIASLRPENLTLILMLFQMMALEAYRDTGKKAYLLALPAVMLAEANLHISMWPIHVCVYLAYFVPYFLPKREKKLKLKFSVCPGLLSPDGVKPDRYAVLAVVASLAVLFLNPYGWDGIMYLFRSMPVFQLVGVTEQEGVYLLSRDTVVNAAMIVLTVILARHKKIHATEACMILGLTALACTNYHNTMYMPVAVAVMARVLLRCLAKQDPAEAKSLMPNGVKSVLLAGVLAFALVSGFYTLPKLQIFADKHGMDPVINYILENKRPGDRIFNNMNMGPMLEYYGVKDLYSDTRPELLMPAITGCEENYARLMPWLGRCISSDYIDEHYHNDIGEYLDQNRITYVTDTMPKPILPYLAGWLDNSPDWRRVELAMPENIKTADKRVYCIWERVESDG